jgi:Putative zinc-finger
MSDILCSYQDREATLMAYLYDEIAPPERETFEAHLITCARCRVELNGLSGVRVRLAEWATPTSHKSQVISHKSQVLSHKSPVVSRELVTSDESRGTSHDVTNDESGGTSHDVTSDEPRAPSPETGDTTTGRRTTIPAWAQAAAAMLALGVSAGAANLTIHYDAQNGLNIHTGWSQGATDRSNGAQPAAASPAADLVSRAELTALTRQLRGEMQTIATPAASAAPLNEADVVRRVKGLLDETERRHERELALRVAEVMRDINAQRQADLVKIDQNLTQGRVEVLRNRQMLDYYMQRVSRPQ